MNTDSLTLTLDRATLLAYNAPPPPCTEPGRTDDELVSALHSEKFEFEIVTVLSNPLKSNETVEVIRPSKNSYIWID